MRCWIPAVTLLIALSVAATVAAPQSGNQRPGYVIVPDTNVQHATDIGVRAHTNYLIFIPAGPFSSSSPSGETPGALECIYGLTSSPSTGCPTSTTASTSGGSNIIAVVDAYDYPTALHDFDTFSDQFGLPTGKNCNGGQDCFTKVFATGVQPRAKSGWALEAALDIEWSHAMAPNAQIFLVEAASNSFTDLLTAVDVASNIVATCNGASTGCKGEVSMSWGGSEFSGETGYDGHFTQSGVVYTAASGDSGGTPIWPSTSPNVVSCGGTTVNRKRGGAFESETAWSDSGGGDSVYEPVQRYQSNVLSVSNLVGSFRGTPDFSYDADPSSGVSVYDSTKYEGLSGWLVVGGTSVSTQALAGIINLAGAFAASSSAELGTIYSNFLSTYGTDFRDITSGSTASCAKHHSSGTCYSAGTGWDFVTGVGSNLGTSGK
jgi:kumamolisin